MYFQNGGDVRRWFDQWCSRHGVSQDERVYHEMKTIVEAFFHGSTFDQLNPGGCAIFEALARRIQALCGAYRGVRPGQRPNYSTAHLYEAEADGADGVAPEMARYVGQRAKQEYELQSLMARTDSRAQQSPPKAAFGGIDGEGNEDGSGGGGTVTGQGTGGRADGRGRRGRGRGAGRGRQPPPAPT